MTYQIGEAQKNQYKADGVVCLRGVISPEDCTRMLDATYRFMEEGEATTDIREESGRYYTSNKMSQTDSVFREFALTSVLPSVAGQLMSSTQIRFFYDQVFLIEPGTQRSTPWHNDLAYWPFEGGDMVSLWVALTKVTNESSPLQYVAGSHDEKVLYQAVSARQTGLDPDLMQSLDYSDPANQAGKGILSWELEPGDVLAHHPLTLHGCHANRSKGQLRCGLSVRYLGDDVRYHPRTYVARPREFNAVPGQYPADDENLPLIAVG